MTEVGDRFFPGAHDDMEFFFSVPEFTQDDYNRLIRANQAYGGKDIGLFPYQSDAGWRSIKAALLKKDVEFKWYWARKTGKTFTAATVAFILALAPFFMEGLPESMKHGVHGGVFGPKSDQASLIFNELSRQFKTGFAEEYFDCEVILQKKIIIIRKEMPWGQVESTIWKSTASKDADIEGPTLNFAFVDEAQDVTDTRLEKSIDPMMATSKGILVLLGTTTYEKEYYFMKEWRKIQKRGESRAPKNVFINRWDARAEFDNDYRDFVQGRIRKRGIENPSIQASYFLKVVPLSGAKFKYLREGEMLADLRSKLVVREYDGPCFVTIDPAKDRDSTVVEVFDPNGKRILNWYWISPMTKRGPVNYTEQVHEIREFLLAYPGVYMIVVDKNGCGPAVGDPLDAPPIQGICPKCKRDLSLYPSYEGMVRRYSSTKPNNSKLAISMRDKIINGEFSYPDEDVPAVLRFEKEFEDAEAMWTGGKKDQMWVGHPEKKGYHDDFVSAHLMTVFGMEFPIPDSAAEFFAHENANRREIVASARAPTGRATRVTMGRIRKQLSSLAGIGWGLTRRGRRR